jgi:hypothetical protein
VELWALIDRSTPVVGGCLGDAVDIFLGEKEARQARTSVLRDEPEWAEILAVERVATVDVSPNYRRRIL